jgi:Predicted metal-binding, possibly nucleic acid-binding protein
LAILFTDIFPMLFNVLNDLRHPIGTVSEAGLLEPEVKAGDLVIRDLQGTARFLRTDRGLLVRMRAKGMIDEECSRCLREVRAPVEVDFEEEYVPLFDPNTGTRIYLGADEEDVTFRVNARFDLDLREGLRQYILMFEPAKPLCRADCAGLCPICGTDMNAGPHECKSLTDERWSALAGLKNEISEGN